MQFLTLQAVLVALAAVFALLAIHSSRRCANLLREMREALSSIRSLRGKVEAHDSELEAVTDSFRQLRGKFYAERRKFSQGGSNSDSDEEATGGSTPGRASATDKLDMATLIDVATLKDHLRRKAGLVPGKPAPHQ